MSRAATRLRRVEQRVFAADPNHPARIASLTDEQLKAETARMQQDRLDHGRRVYGPSWKPYELPTDRIYRDAVIDHVNEQMERGTPPEQLSEEDLDMHIAVLEAKVRGEPL